MGTKIHPTISLHVSANQQPVCDIQTPSNKIIDPLTLLVYMQLSYLL